jgi:hypothetical protein
MSTTCAEIQRSCWQRVKKVQLCNVKLHAHALVSFLPKSSTAPYVLGLTGGMAAGKSTLGRMLSAMGALVWDADAAAKHLYKTDHALRSKVLEQFGHALAIVDGQGQHIDIDRPQLAAKVFSDPESLRWLERQVHPAVAQAFETWKVRQPMVLPTWSEKPPFCSKPEGTVPAMPWPRWRLRGM